MSPLVEGSIHYLNIPENTIENTVAAEWTQMDALIGFSARLYGVYWTSTTEGAVLKLRDSYGEIIYDVEADGLEVAIDQLIAPITVRTPFSYYDSEGGNRLVLFGEYVNYVESE